MVTHNTTAVTPFLRHLHFTENNQAFDVIWSKIQLWHDSHEVIKSKVAWGFLSSG